MANPYTRQSSADIVTGAVIQASHFNDEYNALENAFNATTGHDHTGGAGLGPLIALAGGSIGITGTLAVGNGGTGAATLTDGGILLGSGTGAVTAMAVLADGAVVVGDGTTDPVALAAFTSSTGTLKHESGGLEADISTIVDGDFIVGTGAGTLGLESGATARTSLGVAIGTDVQAWDTQLDDIAALAVTDGNFIVGNGVNWVAESGATARTSLGLTIGTNVQAWDAQLDDLAALAVTDGNFIVGDGVNWVAESGAIVRTSLGLGSIATQAASSVTITGGSVTGITDITVADGGTGASTAAAARTNLSAQEDVVTTRGDIIRGSSGSAAERLALGTAQHVLTSDGTDAVWASLGTPSFSAHRNGIDQTAITASTFVKVQFTTEDFDTNSDFDSTTNYRFTPTVSGKYDLKTAVMLQGLADLAKCAVSIYKNGVEHRRVGDVQQSNSGAASVQVAGSVIVEANGTTDYFEVFVFHNSAGTIDVDGTTAYTYFMGYRIGN